MNTRDIFCDVIDNCLLHLYLTTAETSRFTPKIRRNEILVRYLKPMIKVKRYQASKKEIRRLLALARTESCDLEAKLIELRNLSLRHDKNATDAKRLFNLLSIIESGLGFPSRFLSSPSETQRVPNMIYMLQEHVENGFIESGEQVAPVSLFLESDHVTKLIDLINDTGLFLAKMEQHNLVTKQGHIVLHRPK
ncbi:DUF2913 family protein [Shewanella hanedai]|uniref:DUF2913 family protein n=1 Tax=Shewanella hanedai TaxID=25 RepID=A0A553JTN2_SHEHA|nr:DUF2913 family protein [Shewanella hanedai]TRY15816.1 DUF2913 family protein [Shewanella hanedai]